MRWTRNPVYPFQGIGGLNPSSSAKQKSTILSASSFIIDIKKGKTTENNSAALLMTLI